MYKNMLICRICGCSPYTEFHKTDVANQEGWYERKPNEKDIDFTRRLHFNEFPQMYDEEGNLKHCYEWLAKALKIKINK